MSHESSARTKKSVFEIVKVKKDLSREWMDVEVRYERIIKRGFIEVKYRDSTKPLLAKGSPGNRIEEALPINLIE